MDPNTISLIVSLISGVLGGNIAGAALSDKSLGTIGNSVTGLIGGGIGGYILKALGVIAAVTTAVTGAPEATHAAASAASSFDLGSFLANVGGSGVGGAILTAVVALIKNAASHKAE
jgi:uncharacterized membrane protein YeaQ/YmgE (transglycosylase-associated protein family)